MGYYTSVSDLLKKERLIYPIAPPEPVNDKKRVIAILPYTRMPDTEELTYVMNVPCSLKKLMIFKFA